MSLSLAESWVSGMIRHLPCALDAMRAIEEAEAQKVEATLLVAPELTNDDKAYLVRWTGHEMIALELTPGQRQDFGIMAGVLRTQLEAREQWVELPAARRITLSNVRVADEPPPSGFARLSGTCQTQIDDPGTTYLSGCALRLRYFHPDLRRTVTGFWYPPTPLIRAVRSFEFSFDPLFGPPEAFRGSVALFFQVIVLVQQRPVDTFQRVSNVMGCVVKLG